MPAKVYIIIQRPKFLAIKFIKNVYEVFMQKMYAAKLIGFSSIYEHKCQDWFHARQCPILPLCKWLNLRLLKMPPSNFFLV